MIAERLIYTAPLLGGGLFIDTKPRKILPLGEINVSNLRELISAHPELWDQNTARTENPASPHYGLSDIWARYAPLGVDGSKAHRSIWYESPLTDELEIISAKLMAHLDGEELGGVLITKIPAGKECRPHVDPGWHARYYQKIAVQIESALGQSFKFEGEEFAARPGDVYFFDNAYTHWVPNPTQEDRVTAIFCIKTSAFESLKEQ